MPQHRTRVGVHARNSVQFTESDYDLLRRAKIETLKMMSMTDPTVFGRVRQENSGIEFIVRLYDDRLRYTSRPGPADFCNRMVPIINALRPYAIKFEIHNEPNHAEGVEGWGASDDNARSFRTWYLQVLPALKAACPWASFGFPGLALNHPHRDLEWLEICKDAVEQSDWLGCHCYWQYGNMLKDAWGLRFKLYHERFPNKLIEITEFGNSTPNLPAEELARQFVQYYTELNKYPYLGSASAFIASSPDTAWAIFLWMKAGGEMLPVVSAVGNMQRRAVEVEQWPAVVTPPTPTPTPPTPVPPPAQRLFPETGKTVSGSFLTFFDQYGLDICGYPITDQIVEAGLASQYFQRLGLEEPKAGKIRLKLVGTEALAARAKIAELQTRIEELSRQSPVSGAAQPAIQDITAQLTTHATKRYAVRPLADIQQIVVHHTGTSPTITPQRLADYQVRQLDKPGINYHFLVAADGVIYQTNKLETVSDHAFTRNQESVGVVFPGNFTDSIPTQVQIEAGGKLIAWLLATLRLPADKVVGLGEFVNTQSPGKQWRAGQRWKTLLLAEVDKALQAGVGTDPTAEITALRAEIAGLQAQNAALQAEIERLKQQPAPTPGSGGVRQPDIQDITAQLPTDPANPYPSRALDAIHQIVVHHTATSSTITPQRLAEFQVRQQKKPGAAMHFFVAADGTIYRTNKLKTVSDHAFTRNQESVGVVFPGNFTDTIPTDAQLQAGGLLIAYLLDTLKLDKSSVVGLGEFVNTQSPGKQWLAGQRWKDKLLAKVEQALQQGGENQSALIAALRAEIAGMQAQIATLQAEIARLKEPVVTPPPQPEPTPGDGRVSRPAIQDMIAKLKKHAAKHYNTRKRSDIQTVVIHHSAVAPTVTPQRVAEYHVTKLDWPGAGYHFMVGADGVIYQANAVETVSYHAAKANPRSVGICLLGNFTNVVPPDKQLKATAHLVAWLMQELDVPIDEVKGHQEVLQTACPGNQWLKGKKWKDTLRQEIVEVQKAAQQSTGVTPVDGKVLEHYMLFWQRADSWPATDWANARTYIGAFRPTAGFDPDEAALAQYVTIVGGPLGTTQQTEDKLRAAGCRVDRIAGKDEADTKRILDGLVASKRRFLSFSG